MKKIQGISKLTNTRWLNLYDISLGKDRNGREQHYYFASRRPLEQLVISETSKTSTSSDAVRVLPYFQKEGKTYVAFIKEYRVAIGKYLYELPAGLVENKNGETAETAVERELMEEIGGKVVSLKPLASCVYPSAGMSDESLSLFQAEVELTGEQHLEETEDIKLELVELSQIPQFLASHDFCMSSLLMAQSFYYEKMLEQAKHNQLDAENE